MADNGNTLREILQGFGQMQRRLGLLPGSVTGQQGIQPLNTPLVKHPGQVSAEASESLFRTTQQTHQAVQQIRMLQPPGAVGFTPSGAEGDFAHQFQQRMSAIEANYQDPFQAHTMARQTGQPGFMTLPSPTFMTPPAMGVFRPGFQPPPPISIARTPPMLSLPFTHTPPAPMFQTPLQMQQAQGQMESNEYFAGAMAGIPAAARVGTGLGGVAGGAMLGRRFGGAFGAAAGAIGGGLLGFGPAGGLAEQGTAAGLAPAVERRAFGLQMQDISRNFVVSGPQLAEGGRGLSMRAGIQTANMMRRAVDSDQTAGFNMRDMMGIVSSASDMGMMDMAQNSEQITAQAKNIARGLSAFMRLAQEPDVRRAMQQLASFRSMGLTIPETTVAMQNAQQFARMAGTTVANLGQTAGMPGAMTFQQAGMTAGLGFNVGMGAGGMARQAVAGGAFTPGQLAMAGGVRGVQQQLTEAAGATLGVDFPLMAMLRRNEQGQLAIDPGRARRIASGDVGLSQQAQMAQQNVEQLGGARVITELSTRINELRDELGRTLGPQGTLLMTLGQARTMQRELGPGATLGGALRAMGMNPQQARTMELMAQSPGFWQNLQQQSRQQIADARFEEAERRERAREASTLTGQIQAGLRPVVRAGERVGEMVSGAYDAISEAFSDEANATPGARRVRRSDALTTSNARVQRQMRQLIRSGGFQRFAERSDVAAARAGSRGEDLFGYGERAAVAGTMIADIATMGLTSLAGITGDPGLSDPAVQGRIAAGGAGGALAEMMPNLASVVLHATGRDDVMRARGRDVARSARSITQGRAMTRAQAVRLTRQGEDAMKAFARAYGGDAKTSFGTFKNKAVEGIRRELRNRASMFGDTALGEADKKQLIVKIAERDMGAGAGRAFVEQNWDVIQPLVDRDVDRQVEGKEASVWAKTQQGQGYTGFVAGKTLEDVLENLESQEEDVKERLGMYEGLAASEESWNTLASTIMTSSSEEVLALSALALQGDPSEGTGGAANRIMGRRMLKQVQTRLGPKAAEFMERMRAKYAQTSSETRGALRRAGFEFGKKTLRSKWRP